MLRESVSLTVDRATTSITSGSKVYLTASSGVCRVRGYANAASGTFGTLDLFTIPSGYRPSSMVVIAGFVTDSSNLTSGCNCYVDTDGTINQSATGAAKALFFSGEWKYA